MERHPLVDFGLPGAIVHFVEQIINGSENEKHYIEFMNAIADCNDVEEVIRNQARAFISR